MKRFKFTIIILSIFISFGLTSCTEDDEWVRTTFDYEMPVVDWNGNFQINRTIYINDLNVNTSRYDVIDIEATNSWIELDGDLNRGDEIRIYDITINGTTLNLNYYTSIGPRPEDDRYFTNDPAYKDFMYQALKLLNSRGRIDVSVRGFSNMSQGDLYVILGNNVDIRVRD